MQEVKLTFDQFVSVMSLFGVPRNDIYDHGDTYTCSTREGLVHANGKTGTISVRRQKASYEKGKAYMVTDGVALYKRCFA